MNPQNLKQENGMLSVIKITNYGEGNEYSTTVKFETKITKSSLCDYSDSYILVTGDITGTGGDANTRVEFKNCSIYEMHNSNSNQMNTLMVLITLIL